MPCIYECRFLIQISYLNQELTKNENKMRVLKTYGNPLGDFDIT